MIRLSQRLAPVNEMFKVQEGAAAFRRPAAIFRGGDFTF